MTLRENCLTLLKFARTGTEGAMDGDPAPERAQAESLLRALTNQDQDPRQVEQICAQVQGILTRDETVVCVAVQRKPVVNIAPDSVVLTNRRFIRYRPRLFGRVSFDDYLWRDLSDVQLREEVLGATLSMTTHNGQKVSVDYLPRAQARRLYAFAQEMEEKVREELRRRQLEEKRAAAGGVVVGSSRDALHGWEDSGESHPVQRLKKLKEMLDAGLITQSEFDGKRAEIISQI